jgi:chromate transporter
VVGILAAALYNPIWTTAVHDGADVAVAAGALVLLLLRAAPLFAVVLCVACSVLRALL